VPRTATPATTKAPRIFTIGYQGHSIESLLRTLNEHRVQVLMDVRQNPVSRKAGFSKSRLQNAILQAGITYVHTPELGTPREIRLLYQRSGNVSAALAEYDRYLSCRTEAIRSLASLAAVKAVCLFCLETDHRLCHRNIIARKLCEMTRWQPIHLI